MMKRLLIIVSLLLVAGFFFSEVSLADNAPDLSSLQLAKAPVNPFDMASIKRGAKFFATNCMTCHTLIYLRYDKVAQDAGITYDKMPINVKTWPLGVAPPDLSLMADIKGVDWIYTYLHSFYQDPSRPTGYNNLVFPDTAMPDIVGPYQGTQIFISGKADAGILTGNTQWYDWVELTKQGSMTPEEFDATITDVVNFLNYAAEPYRVQQERIGVWVIVFLCVLLVLMYLLKREYWKDVNKHKK
jgi:ubiquinol-cytochrome c reductase cytochrome c1 subunit